MESKNLSLLQAGSIYRHAKLSALEEAASQIGMESVKEYRELLHHIEWATQQLESLRKRQEEDDSAPWWADGQYDASEADRANEAGVHHCRQKEYGPAFDCFTQAIRLKPASPVFHCNRAQASLKLKKFQLASIDAENAIARDKTYFSAYLKAGEAHLQCSAFDKAISHYTSALAIKPQCNAAKNGLAKAEICRASQAGEQATERALANVGSRPALNLFPPLDPAEQLEAAEQLCQAHPSREAAKADRVEALIFCQRYDDAARYCKELLPGIDRLYLQAEIAWRSGHLASSLSRLRESKHQSRHVKKCEALLAKVSRLTALEEACQNAMEAENYQECILVCDDALASADPRYASPLHSRFQQSKAEACAARLMPDTALQCLDATLLADPYNIESLLLKSKILSRMGKFVESFLVLHELQQFAPETPDLLNSMHEVAASIEAGPQKDREQPASGSREGFLDGLSGVDSNKTTKSLYRKAAAKWHPDKWLKASKAAQAKAAQNFLAVQKAYEEVS